MGNLRTLPMADTEPIMTGYFAEPGDVTGVVNLLKNASFCALQASLTNVHPVARQSFAQMAAAYADEALKRIGE